MISTDVARELLARWDAQQERYAFQREERFDVICGVLKAFDVSGPVVDLGCGPGSLAARIALHIPDAQPIGVDADPFLLALGKAAYPGVEFVQAMIGDAGWERCLEPYSAPAAVVSSTALHYPSTSVLGAIYRDLARLLPIGAVLINADMFPLSCAILDTAAAALPGQDWIGEDWNSWWESVHRDPRLAAALGARARTALPEGGDNGLSAEAHITLMQIAGFRAVGEVWRYGRSAVIVAAR